MGHGLNGRGQDPVPVPQSSNLSVRKGTAPESRVGAERRYNVGYFRTCIDRGMVSVWLMATDSSILTFHNLGRNRRAGCFLQTLEGYTVCGKGVE
jgi:hypothetical protein